MYVFKFVILLLLCLFITGQVWGGLSRELRRVEGKSFFFLYSIFRCGQVRKLSRDKTKKATVEKKKR